MGKTHGRKGRLDQPLTRPDYKRNEHQRDKGGLKKGKKPLHKKVTAKLPLDGEKG